MVSKFLPKFQNYKKEGLETLDNKDCLPPTFCFYSGSSRYINPEKKDIKTQVDCLSYSETELTPTFSASVCIHRVLIGLIYFMWEKKEAAHIKHWSTSIISLWAIHLVQRYYSIIIKGTVYVENQTMTIYTIRQMIMMYLMRLIFSYSY